MTLDEFLIELAITTDYCFWTVNPTSGWIRGLMKVGPVTDDELEGNSIGDLADNQIERFVDPLTAVCLALTGTFYNLHIDQGVAHSLASSKLCLAPEDMEDLRAAGNDKGHPLRARILTALSLTKVA